MSVGLSVSAEIQEEIKKFTLKREYKAMVFGMVKQDKEDKIALIKAYPKDSTLEALVNELPDNECRVIYFNHLYQTNDGIPTEKIISILYTTMKAKPDQRFKATHCHRTLNETIDASKVTMQVSDRSEITVESLTKVCPK